MTSGTVRPARSGRLGGGRTRPAGQQVTDAAREAAEHPAVSRLARFGLASRGVVYLVVGYLAVRIAWGGATRNPAESTGHAASATGAVAAVGQAPGGRLALAVLAVGLAGYAVFSLLDTVLHHNHETPWVKRWGDRALSAFGVVLYGGLCAWTVSTALTGSRGKGSAAASHVHKAALTARVLRLPGGQELAGAVGVVLCVAGLFLVRRAFGQHFADRFPPGRIGRRTWPVVLALGGTGYFFRGVAFAIVGGVIVDAAVTFQPSRGVGLDGALRLLAGQPFGPWLLFPTAVGLICYALYLGFETVYRRV